MVITKERLDYGAAWLQGFAVGVLASALIAWVMQ